MQRYFSNSRTRMSAIQPSQRLYWSLIIASLIAGLYGLPALSGGTPDPGSAPLQPDSGDADPFPDNENQLFNMLGPQRGFAAGDYVSDAIAGLQRQPGEPDRDGNYRFGIEIPPSQSLLVVELFDADIGAGEVAGTENHDQDNDNGWESQVSYELLDPTGSAVASITLGSQDCDPVTAGTQTNCDNRWSDLGVFRVLSPAPGHWQLRARMIIAGAADDNNAFGIRAYDGDATAGGVEYPVYAASYVALGHLYGPAVAPPSLSRSHDLFPMITGHCAADLNDFDSDDSGDEQVILSPPRLPGSTAQYHDFSGDSAWNQIVASDFSDDTSARNYGLWDLRWITGAHNVFSFWMGDASSVDPVNPAGGGAQPDSNPIDGAIRLYLPADGSRYFGERGGADDVVIAPRKPWIGQSYSIISGANPPSADATSRALLVIAINNPTASPIQFDSTTGGSRVVTLQVPANAGQSSYVAGSAAISNSSAAAGSGIDVNGTGPWAITFAPGVVDAESSALLSLEVDLLPTTLGTIELTDPAAPSAARYTDETCASAVGASSVCTAAALATADQLFGPLCGLRAVISVFDPIFADGFED